MALVPRWTLEHGEVFRGGSSNHPITPIILIYTYPPRLEMSASESWRHSVPFACLVDAGEDDVQWRTSAPRRTGLPVVSHLAVVF